MRYFSIAIVLFFFACKKDGSSKSGAWFIYDSARGMESAFYRLDINADNIPDLKLDWQGWCDNIPSNYCWGRTDIVALHNQVSIHATQQFAQFCKDVSYSNGWPDTKIYNCTGGPQYLRTDTFVATPNLDSLSLINTQVNKMGDAVLLYRQNSNWESYYSETRQYGFFANASSGFLLFKLAEKRYALKLKSRGDYLPLIDKLVQIDP